MQKLTIPIALPSLNEHLALCNLNRFAGARAKKGIEESIGWAIRASRLKPIDERVAMRIDWYEAARRRDFDNVCSAKKFILDALQKQGILKGDGWRHLADPKPFSEYFHVDRASPRVEVRIYTEGELKAAKAAKAAKAGRP
jgi:Holliday junction resolvase RusA-like endonuclease